MVFDEAQYERELRRAKRIKWDRLNARIDRKLAEIDGKPSRIAGECEICGEPHGTIKVERHAGGTFTICPIAYWLRRFLECLHLDKDLGEFMEKNPIETVL